MSETLISICVPLYNGEKYLNECLDSCVSQVYKNFEVIICDDGSTDNSLKIVNSYLGKGVSIQIHQNESNLGLVGNWNKCIELAKGDWIKFLFQDDILTPDCLRVFNEHITENTELITCKRNFILNENVSAEKKDYYARQVRTLENTGFYVSPKFSGKVISKIALSNLTLNFIAEPSLVLFKKDIINKIGPFDPDLKQICDLEFLLRISCNFGLTYIPKKLCGFRIHDHSTTEKNISGNDYHLRYLETLIFALKLNEKSEFASLRNSIDMVQRQKLKWYIKYKSYVAYTAISSKNEANLYNNLKKKHAHLFFKPYEKFLLYLLKKLQQKRNS